MKLITSKFAYTVKYLNRLNRDPWTYWGPKMASKFKQAF